MNDGKVKIGRADRVFVLTGAGVSAESGIATFRGAGGLWQGYRVEEVASPFAWRRDPELVWKFYSMRRRAAADKKPNPGHLALAELEKRIGERLFLCTQNVDSLHELARSKRVVHMHGHLFQSRCEGCDRAPFDDNGTYETLAEVPVCACGGRIRPHICWFGEMPFDLETIFEELAHTTVFLAVGTSGVVEPAASFVARARQGVRTYYVGPEPPANAAMFDHLFLGPSGEVLPTLFEVEEESAAARRHST